MIYEFKFPDVGEGIHEGKILQFKWSPHDNINQGDVLAVIETDKVVAEIPSSKSGELIKYGFKEGDTIEVGQTLAYINVKDDNQKAQKTVKVETAEEEAGVVGQLESASGHIMSAPKDVVQTIATNVKATPLARKVANKLGIDISKIRGSGPAGRVLRADLLEHSTSFAKGNLIKEEFSVTRKAIAFAMETSAMIPSASFFEEVLIEKLMETRSAFEKISLQAVIMKIMAIALQEFPSFNGTFDRTTNEFSKYHDINIGFAADTPKGLMVPVIKAIQTKNIITINEEMKALAKKAIEATITLDNLKEGTISISNYGPFGGLYGTPMIAPPQVAIIGLGRIEKRAVVNPQNNSLEVGKILPLSFTFDHRVNDGAIAGKFITRLKELLENPEKLFFYLS